MYFLKEAESLLDLFCSEKYLAVRPQKRATLAAPTKRRHSSYWQEAMSYIAFIGSPLKLSLQ